MFLTYIAAWFGLMLLAVANGGARDALYRKRVGDLAAHQLSTVSLLLVITAYVWMLSLLRPLDDGAQAWAVGAAWLVMTLCFEFGIGRFVSRKPWRELLRDYNILAGRVWILIPLWVLLAPYLFWRMGR